MFMESSYTGQVLISTPIQRLFNSQELKTLDRSVGGYSAFVQSGIYKMDIQHKVGLASLGARLRLARQAKDMSQEDLAGSVGVAQQTIDKIERSITKMPKLQLMIKLARELDVSPGWLTFGLEELDKLDRDAVLIAKAWAELPEEEKEAFRKLLLGRQQKQLPPPKK